VIARGVGTRSVLRYAWPTVLSCLCNSAFRINDQYWVGPLGRDAQAALGASTFVMVLNFALYFLAVAGSMAKVAKATGAGDRAAQEKAIHHGLALSTGIALCVGVVGYQAAPWLVRMLGLSAGVGEAALEYIRGTYWMALPIALAPLLDNLFLSMGDTRTPLKLQMLAIASNFVLNPLLIYGGLPGSEGTPTVFLGVYGAAYATGISRALAVLVALWVLVHRKGIRLIPHGRLSLPELAHVARVGMPSCVSIAIYGGVYLTITERIFQYLPDAALAGFGIGFNAFEAVSYPTFFGIALAGASMVGRALGAGDLELAQRVVVTVRRIALTAGVLAGVLFVVLGPWIVPAFTSEPEVAHQALVYLGILAFSQVFVALETASENVLIGSGHTKPIFWISVPGNLARVPLGILLALTWGWGPAGLWWAINITSIAKALALHALVVRGRWKHALPAPLATP